MKKVVMLSLVVLAVAAYPAYACGDKECEHSKVKKSDASETVKPAKEAANSASIEKIESSKTVATTEQTRTASEPK